MRTGNIAKRQDAEADDRPRQSPSTPYGTTPVFDENNLPDALRNKHCTKAGAWGVIRVLDGKLRLVTLDPPAETILTAGRPGILLPEQPHLVEPLGAMKMQIEFYRQLPEL